MISCCWWPSLQVELGGWWLVVWLGRVNAFHPSWFISRRRYQTSDQPTIIESIENCSSYHYNTKIIQYWHISHITHCISNNSKLHIPPVSAKSVAVWRSVGWCSPPASAGLINEGNQELLQSSVLCLELSGVRTLSLSCKQVTGNTGQ